MDRETLKLLKAELKDDMKQRGFKTEGQWYMRLSNAEIYQAIYIQGSSGGDEFTVNIYLDAACSGNTQKRIYGVPIRLGALAHGGRDHWWDYSESSAKDVAEQMRKLAFPFLDICTTYRGMFEFVKHIIDGAEDELPRKIFYKLDTEEWVRILVKLSELEYCKRVLNNSIQMWSERAKKDANDPYYLARDNAAMSKDKVFLAKIESGDLDDIKAETEQNETLSLDALAKYNVKV